MSKGYCCLQNPEATGRDSLHERKAIVFPQTDNKKGLRTSHVSVGKAQSCERYFQSNDWILLRQPPFKYLSVHSTVNRPHLIKRP